MSSCSSSSDSSLGSSSGSSHTVEAENPSPQVVSRPTKNPRLVVVGLSSGRATPADSKVVEALEAMKSCYDSDSTLMARRLVEVLERFHIPSEYELHVPLPGQRPYDVFLNGIGLSTDALEARLWFPLHPVIGLSHRVADFSFAYDTQLVTLSGGIPLAMLQVEHRADPGPIRGVLPPLSGAGRVLSDCPKWNMGRRGPFSNKGL
ncbi:hypothetical protein BHE74_00037765 [Ensete ventricosum]|nr:hypothetical protein BHE74_00037765 [Ensete ventricosum]